MLLSYFTCCDASDVLRVDLADGEEAQLGAAVGVEHATHAGHHLRVK